MVAVEEPTLAGIADSVACCANGERESEEIANTFKKVDKVPEHIIEEYKGYEVLSYEVNGRGDEYIEMREVKPDDYDETKEETLRFWISGYNFIPRIDEEWQEVIVAAFRRYWDGTIDAYELSEESGLGTDAVSRCFMCWLDREVLAAHKIADWSEMEGTKEFIKKKKGRERVEAEKGQLAFGL